MGVHGESVLEKCFRYANAVFLGILALLMLLPLITVVSTSISSAVAVDMGRVFLWPVEFTTASWERILGREALWQSFGVTVAATVLGTGMSLMMTALLAYPMAKKEFALAKIISIGVIVTMVFRYPIIPYFLTLRDLGLFDSFWVLIVPHMIVAYNLIIMRTFFKELPIELEEAAQLEGCGYFQILFRIVLPLSKAVLATLGIFYAVMIWNQFMHPLLFIENQDLYPLQLRLRQYIVSAESIEMLVGDELPKYNATTLRAATIIFATLPIVIVYPFLQKHFVKGALLGSVK
ncbi:carbohydrate ABC transporter permease [Paenibacillus sp. J5C_2022]|uniref:carbohydrate ABC transporter permease n=1 Tax=Paenibacillus sp. J5C2022 TaxID=2977129 RepID=UPI0021CEB6BC|nr:carbohydrate ABC transporter permease [Paenibacillus sp. J5C2022]MCU6712120.1 carbohydrate ABC transporter permease [Paenibacillus sp. J5C2022]